MNQLERIAAYLAGVSVRLLSKCPLHEQQKYPNLGMLVAMVGLFGWISAVFALKAIFDLGWQVVAVGFLWGSLIVLIDRYLLTTFPKRSSAWRQVGHAVPRFIFAILIGVVVAHPLQLAIFGPEILKKHTNIGNGERKVIEDEWRASKDRLETKKYSEKEQLAVSKNVKGFKDNLEAKQAGSLACQEVLTASQAAAASCRERPVCGKEFFDKEACDAACKNSDSALELTRKRCNKGDAAVDGLLNDIRDAGFRLEAEEARIDKKYEDLVKAEGERFRLALESQREHDKLSLLTQTSLLWEVIDEKEAWGMYFAVAVLFAFIEILVVSLKLMTPRGDYDEAVQHDSKDFMIKLPAIVASLYSRLAAPYSSAAAPEAAPEDGAAAEDVSSESMVTESRAMSLTEMLVFVFLLTVSIMLALIYFEIPDAKAAIVATIFGGCAALAVAVRIRKSKE